MRLMQNEAGDRGGVQVLFCVKVVGQNSPIGGA